MWQPCNLLSLSHCPSRTQPCAHTAVDLIQYMAASGKVALGWLMCSLPGSGTIRADKGTSGVIHGRFTVSHPKVLRWIVLHTREEWSPKAPRTAWTFITTVDSYNVEMEWSGQNYLHGPSTTAKTAQQLHSATINTQKLIINVLTTNKLLLRCWFFRTCITLLNSRILKWSQFKCL